MDTYKLLVSHLMRNRRARVVPFAEMRGHQEQAIIVIPSKHAVLACLSLVESGDVSELQDWLVGVVER